MYIIKKNFPPLSIRTCATTNPLQQQSIQLPQLAIGCRPLPLLSTASRWVAGRDHVPPLSEDMPARMTSSTSKSWLAMTEAE